MAKRDSERLPRLERPPFKRIVETVKATLGPVGPIDQYTVRSQRRRIRIALARKTDSPTRFGVTAGKGDFDYLAFGLDGRDEVWIVPRKVLGPFGIGPSWINGGDPPNAFEKSRLTRRRQSLELKAYLRYPTKEMRRSRRQTPETPVGIVEVPRGKLEERETLLRAVTPKMRAWAFRRLENDEDLSRLARKVSAMMGELEPIGKNDWILENGDTVHFAMSKPFRGTNDRAFIQLTPDRKRAWLAVGVRSSPASWLIPMNLVLELVGNKQPKTRKRISFYLGHKGDGDCLWMSGGYAETECSIDQFKLYSDIGNRIDPAQEKARHKQEREELAARQRRLALESRIASDPDDAAVFEVLKRRFGDLIPVSRRPYALETSDGHRITFATVTPFHDDERRARIVMSDHWFDSTWIAVAVKGRKEGWLVPSSIIEALVANYPANPGSKTLRWNVMVGPRDGRDRLWVGRNYKNGGHIDLTNYRFLRHQFPRQTTNLTIEDGKSDGVKAGPTS